MSHDPLSLGGLSPVGRVTAALIAPVVALTGKSVMHTHFFLMHFFATHTFFSLVHYVCYKRNFEILDGALLNVLVNAFILIISGYT